MLEEESQKLHKFGIDRFVVLYLLSHLLSFFLVFLDAPDGFLGDLIDILPYSSSFL
jgi:hypothetical protein